MKTLLLLRHAKSSHEGEADRERPLNERGQGDAPLMGKALRKIGSLPDRVLCSPAVRAQQTSDLVLKAARYESPVETCEEIYHNDAGELIELVQRQIGADRLLLVGHNPSFEQVVGSLSSGTARGVRLPTAALACLEFDVAEWSAISPGSGELVWLLIPRLVETL